MDFMNLNVDLENHIRDSSITDLEFVIQEFCAISSSSLVSLYNFINLCHFFEVIVRK